MLRRRVLLIILPLLLMSLADGPVAAQDETGITWSAEASFGGVFKYGEWLPVRVALANEGPNRRVEIRATISSGESQATYARRVELPHGARKQVMLYVRPNSFSRHVTLVLLEGERELSKITMSVEPRSAWETLVGIAARRPDALSDLAAVRVEGPRGEIQRISLSLDGLPDRAEGLRSLDTLVLNDVDTSRLTSAQQRALSGWVQLGGRLILGGGAGAAQTLAGLPEALRPGRLLDTRSVEALPGLTPLAEGISVRVPGPFVVAEVEPGVDADVLAEEAGVPLVVRRTFGDGAVVFVALDLDRSPFGEWTGAPAFWNTLLMNDRPVFFEGPPDASPLDWEAGPMLSALTNLPSLELPSIGWVVLLLLIYIVLVGPVNYLMLRRRRRLEWAWATIPLLTVAFSGLAYGVGYGLRGGDVILNQLSIIELTPDNPTARVRTYVGLFSPAKRAYSLRVTGGVLAGPLSSRFGGPWGPPTGGASITVIQGDPTIVRDLTVNQWSMQTFMAEGMVDVPVGLETEFRYENGRLVGRVTNRGPHTLDDVAVVMSNDFTHLGTLSPGESREVRLPIAATGERFGPPISYRLFREQFENPGPGGLSREVRLKQQMLEAVFNARWNSGIPTSSGPLVLAWTDTSPMQVAVEGVQVRTLRRSLILARVPLRLGNRVVSVPPGVIPARLVERHGNAGTCGGPAGIGYIPGNGSVVLEFDLARALRNVEIERLTLVLASDGGWWQPPHTALYDWTTEGWVELKGVRLGPNPINGAARFVDPARHAVRVRLSATDTRGGCLYTDLGLEGRRKT